MLYVSPKKGMEENQRYRKMLLVFWYDVKLVGLGRFFGIKGLLMPNDWGDEWSIQRYSAGNDVPNVTE